MHLRKGLCESGQYVIELCRAGADHEQHKDEASHCE